MTKLTLWNNTDVDLVSSSALVMPAGTTPLIGQVQLEVLDLIV